MISSDTLSIELLRSVFSEGGVEEAPTDSVACLGLKIHDRTFLVAVIGNHQVRFLSASVAAPSSKFTHTDLLDLVNEFNADVAFTSGAYLSEEDDIVFTQAFSVSGGISNANVLIALHEFAVECAIHDQLVEKKSH